MPTIADIVSICQANRVEILNDITRYGCNIVILLGYHMCFLKKKHSILPLFLFVLLKAIFFNDIFLIQMGQVYSEQIWFQVFAVIGTLLFLLANPFVLYWTFEGGILKVTLGSILSDFLGGCVYSFVTVLYAVIQKSDIGQLVIDGVWMRNLEGQLFSLLIAALIMYSIRPLAKRYREYHLANRLVWYLIILLYYVIAFSSYTFSIFPQWKATVFSFWFLCGMGFTAIVGVLVYFFFFESRRMEKENDYLNRQKRLQEEYIADLKNQQTRNQKYWNTIDNQMHILDAMDDEHLERRLSSYLVSLKREYQELRKKEVSTNLLVNALAEKESDRFQKNGITAEWKIEDFPEDSEMEQDILSGLQEILKEAVYQCQASNSEVRQIEIRVGRQKEQWYFQVTFPNALPMRMHKKYKYRVKKTRETIQVFTCIS